MAGDLLNPTWDEIRAGSERLAGRWSDAVIDGVYGVPRGGVPVALCVAPCLGVPVVGSPGAGVLVVDDLVDSGRTLGRYPDSPVDALYRKPHSPAGLAPDAQEIDGWIAFPWEALDGTGPEDAVVRLLEWIGEDPGRDGLRDTPARVVKALAEMTSGHADDPAAILATQFDGDGFDEMVVLRGIEFSSLCEHHLLPFTGTVDVAYIADGPVVGLSKLARLVDCFARRLQLQERMTQQIAQALDKHLAPRGVGVVVRAHHSCMACRGVRKPTAEMVTSTMLGALRDKPEARAEFLGLA